MAALGDDLAPFILQNVRELTSGNKKGSGAYGAVYEVTVNDVRCIAKRLHDILVNEEVSSRERASIQEKFRQECILLSRLRHPNVVHFVGVHYGQHPGDLSLVMERLHTDLGKFLDSHPAQIPLSIKLSILLDISYGLLYLHSHSPPIVHRDLSANNILLTKDLRAVIADLGVSKLLNLQQQTKKLTKAPGTLYYMPPEALKEVPVYDVSLDAFSFGHLSLYVANQEFPNVYEITMTQLVVQQQTIQISRRRRAIDELGEDHCLYPIIIHCLQDLPERRPTTSEINSTLKMLTEKHPKSQEDVNEVSRQVKQPEEFVLVNELRSELESVQAKMGELKQQEESARLRWESMRDDCRALHQKNQELFAENHKLEEDNKLFIDDVKKISKLGNENADLQRNIIAIRKEKEDLWSELQAVKAESQLYKEDFVHEREDRAMAHAQMDDLRTECTCVVEEARRELMLHKERLTEVEAVNKRKEGELRSALEEALAARQEVQAKTSQGKQYKKQVDSLKAQVADSEKQNVNLIQEMERVRKQLVKVIVKKEDEKKHKKKSTEKVPGLASSPVAPPPPGWESRVSELENINEELRNKIDNLKHDNEVLCVEAKNLHKMNDSLKMLLGQQHVDRAHVPPHGFPPGTTSDVMPPSGSGLSPTGAAAGDQFGMQRGALVLQQPHPPPVAGYDQDQQRIRQQLQQGFQHQHQHQPHTEEHTAGAGGLPSRLSSLPQAQPFPSRARIPPPDSQPHASRSSKVAPYSDQKPAISPTSHPYHNWPPSSGAGNLPVQQPGAKAFTDSQMIAKHNLPGGQFHSAYPATDSNPTIPPPNVAQQRHIQPQPPNYQRQRSGSGSSPQGQQQQPTYVAKDDPLMQHIHTDIHTVVSEVSEERTHQATMQHVPYDPNLVCVYCHKQFRIGEIQKYKHHVGTCGGSDGTEV